MRLADIFYSFPFLILAIISAIFGPSIYNTMIILGVLSWPGPARLLRAEFLKLKTTDFVAAATALGARPGRIMFRHILPNAFSPLLVSATLQVASSILSEAGLSFLGLAACRLHQAGVICSTGHRPRMCWRECPDVDCSRD